MKYKSIENFQFKGFFSSLINTLCSAAVFILFLTTALPVSSMAQGQLAKVSDFNLEDLKSTIRQKNIKSLDDLLPEIPLYLRQNPLLPFDSHALSIELVNPLTPRIILYNKDASLIISMTRKPKKKVIERGDDKLEYLSFDKSTNKWEIGTVAFNGKDVGFSASTHEKFPANCVGCHGSSPRPLFQNYNSWPGFYGSFSTESLMLAGSKERDYFISFLQNMTKNPDMNRYKHLDLSGLKVYSLDSKGEMDQGRPLYKPEAPLTIESLSLLKASDSFGWPAINRPAMIPGAGNHITFGQQINLLMFRRFAQTLKEHPEYSRVKSLIAYLGAPAPHSRIEGDLDVFEPCGPVRDRFSRTIGLLKQKKSNEEIAKIDLQIRELSKVIYNQAKIDNDSKNIEFFKFSMDKIDGKPVKLDPRGVVNFFKDNLEGRFDPYYSVNAESFRLQMVILESLLQKLKLNVSDISTSSTMPTTGIFHVPFGGLYADEQFFQGVVKAMIDMDPNYVAENYFVPGERRKCWNLQESLASESINFIGVGTRDLGVIGK